MESRIKSDPQHCYVGTHLIYINPLPHPPNKSKGKCTTAMYTMLHNHTKDFQCGIRSCPPIQNADILPCFLSPYFFYG